MLIRVEKGGIDGKFARSSLNSEKTKNPDRSPYLQSTLDIYFLTYLFLSFLFFSKT